jgi:mRNA interferase MazF
MKSKIVLIHFPFTDLTDSKLRPALVIHESELDVVVAFISSKIPGYLQDSDFLIAMDHPSFFSTGLKVSSVIKFDKIATISKDLIEGEIGGITRDLADECNLVLHRIFIL